MSNIVPDTGGRQADLLDQWVGHYSRGHYTEVVRAWEAARARVPVQQIISNARVVEAIGWSLALTKSWL